MYEVKCKHCSRFLFFAADTTIVQGVICSNSKCKAKLNIKVVNSKSTEEQMRHVFTEAERPPKAKIPTSPQ